MSAGRPQRNDRGQFLPSNRAARKHGLHAVGELERVIEGIRPEVDGALAAAPDDPARYQLARRTLEQRFALCELLAAYLNEAGMIDVHGKPRAAVAQLLKAWAALDAALRASGLTPQSAAKLAVDAADAGHALDALRERGREILERQENGHGS